MTKRTMSFADYEEPTWEEYTGEDPPVGKWFNATVTKGRYDAEGDQMVFICEINDGDYKGWGRGWYAPFEGERKFKFHTIVKALQKGATKDVTLDWENEKAVAAWLAKMAPIKIKIGEYNDRINIQRVAPMLEAVPTGKAAAKASAIPAEPEPEADDEPVDDYTAEELGEMEASDLEEILVEEFELAKDDEDFPKKSRRDRTGAKYKADLIEAILAEQEGDEGEDDDVVDAEIVEDADDFEDGFEGDDTEPEPAPTARRSRGTKAAPAKAAPPAKAAASTRRRRG
jgi:hypothetical protein